MVADDLTSVVQATQRLKRLTSLASAQGFTYAEMCERMGINNSWTPNSLKQFVNRKGTPRSTPNVVALAEVVSKYYLSGAAGAQAGSSLAEDIAFVTSTLLNSSANELIRFLEAKMAASKSVASSFFLPEKFAYLRYDIANERIAIILVRLIRRAGEFYFTMIIHGKNGKRRVVIGQILSTLSNTHLFGLSFEVSEFLDEEKFATLSFHSASDIHAWVSSNPIGVEQISIDNDLLRGISFPVCFTGLDGGGRPIAGIGIFINESATERLGITQNHPGMAIGSEVSDDVARLLSRAGANTISLPSDKE